jgi:hypothetical protein
MILGEALTGAQIGGGLAVLLGIFVARQRPRISGAQAVEGAPPPKPVAPPT